MPQGYVKTIVKLDISSNVKNVGEQSYAFSLVPNNVSRTCVLQEDGTWLLTEKTHRNYGSNLYMYGNKLRPRNVVGKDLSYDGVRFGETDENGLLDLTLTVTAAGADGLVQGVIVYGDFYALQYATEAELDDGTIIKSNDEVWAIRWNEPAKTHTVTFKKWNRANYNACFTHLTVLPSVLEFDRRKLRHVDSLSQCTGQRDTIWYGVIWNTGSIEIWDSDGEIYDYIKDGIIEDTQMPIIIENRGRHGATALQHHLNARASYEIETRMLKIELTNKLEAWDTMKYAGRALTEACTAWELLVEVFGTIGYTEDDVKTMCDKKIPVLIPSTKTNIEMTVEEFFRAVTIPYPYLEESTFREAITKFCQLGMLWCYCDDDDNIKFVSARPKLLQGELDRAYTWPNSRIYGPVTRDVFLRNKFKRVETQVNNANLIPFSISISFTGYRQNEDGSIIEPFSNENDYGVAISDFTTTRAGTGGATTEYVIKNATFDYITQYADAQNFVFTGFKAVETSRTVIYNPPMNQNMETEYSTKTESVSWYYGDGIFATSSAFDEYVKTMRQNVNNRAVYIIGLIKDGSWQKRVKIRCAIPLQETTIYYWNGAEQKRENTYLTSLSTTAQIKQIQWEKQTHTVS